MKKCSKCSKNKELDSFPKNKSSRDGRYSICKTCKYSKNKKYKKANKEQEIARNATWYLNNIEYKNNYYKKYYAENKYRYHLAYLRRLDQIKRATLPGYKQEIDIIYKNRPDGYHVDHIVPLQGENVSGLHVPWNLRCMEAKENLSKSNKLEI